MGSPAATGPPGQTTAQISRRSAAALPRDTRAARDLLRTFGFHMLAVLLGIALAFM